MEKINATFSKGIIVSDFSKQAQSLYEKSRFGEIKKRKIYYSMLETAYLINLSKLKVCDGRGKELNFDNFVKKVKKFDKNFWTRYSVFEDMRSRGYVIKTALKFGADFRVYDRGIKPGKAHARWILYPVNESDVMTWYGFAAKNRVAHSTRKSLLLGIVDSECDVTYYEVNWLRP